MIDSGNYILEGREVVRVDDIVEWGRRFEKLNRIIDKTKIGDFTISTVFLGTNHAYDSPNDVIVFETMVFHKATEFREYACERYQSYDQAEAGHKEMVGRVMGGEIKEPTPEQIKEHFDGKNAIEKLMAERRKKK